MIWAVEAQNQGLACTECTDRLKRERGCNRPGEEYGDGDIGFRTTSPLLHNSGDLLLRECPIGYVIREAPYVFESMAIEQFVESGNLGPSEIPRTTSRIIAIASSERKRHREMKKNNDQGKRDSALGLQVRRGR